MMTKGDFVYVARLFGVSEELGGRIRDRVVEKHPNKRIAAQRVALRLISLAHVDPSDLSSFDNVFEVECQMDVKHAELLEKWAEERRHK